MSIADARRRLQQAADQLADPTETALVRREDLLLAIAAMTDVNHMQLSQALRLVRAWADLEIISDTCLPKHHREPGCLSCDALHFLETAQELMDE